MATLSATSAEIRYPPYAAPMNPSWTLARLGGSRNAALRALHTYQIWLYCWDLGPLRASPSVTSPTPAASAASTATPGNLERPSQRTVPRRYAAPIMAHRIGPSTEGASGRRLPASPRGAAPR